ncbi:MAG: DUF4168 domain-containing protein [Balneolales bacterium]
MKITALIAAFGLLICLPFDTHGQQFATDNIFIITSDGLRWHEVFMGAEQAIIQDHVENAKELKELFWREELKVRREALMPFFWSTIAEQGQLYGNRNLGSKMNVTNSSRASYPGYNEILTGFYDDDRVITNYPIFNPNWSILDFFNEQEDLNGSVGVVASWWSFPEIINAPRSKVNVIAGPQGSQPSIMPQPDTLTHENVMKYIRESTPRVAMLVYDDTDNRAHEGGYEGYLKAANKFDAYVQELWEFVQSHPQYKNRTTFLITTDHGRGIGDQWSNHGSGAAHSNEVWMAVLGPDTPARGEDTPGQYNLNQVAASAAAFLGLEYVNERKVGKAVDGMFKFAPAVKPAVREPSTISAELTEEQLYDIARTYTEIVDRQRKQQRATPWIPTQEKADAANKKLQEDVVKIIQDQGFTLDFYEEIVQSLRSDPDLQEIFFKNVQEIRVTME